MSTLESYLLLPNKSDLPSKIITDFNTGVFPKVSDREFVRLRKELGSYILNQRGYFSSINRLTICSLIDQRATFEYLRRNGLLRQSKFILKKESISPILAFLLTHVKELNIHATNISYLNSIKAMVPTHMELRKLRALIVCELVNTTIYTSRGKSIIKSLASLVDSLFQQNHDVTQRDDSSLLSYYSKEEIAEAFSLILYLHAENAGLSSLDTLDIDVPLLRGNTLINMLVAARKYRDILDIEVLIDHFGYLASVSDVTTTIVPPDEGLDKAIQLGWIRQTLQVQFMTYEMMAIADEKEMIPYEKMISLIDESLPVVVLREDKGLRRYAIELPEPLLEHFGDLIRSGHLFKEDIVSLINMCKEHLMNPDELKNRLISDNLTLYDLISARSMIIMIRLLYDRHMGDISREFDVYHRTLIPVFSEQALKSLFCKLFEIEKAEQLIDILTWKHVEGKIFDLQLQPFIRAGDWYMLPIYVFSVSNIVRNTIASENRRSNPFVHSDGEDDTLVPYLAEAFTEKGFKVKQNIKYSFNGKKGDIDLIAATDDGIFIAECKNTIHPASYHELRNVLDNVLKAQSQLDKIKEIIQNIGGRMYLEDLLGISINNAINIEYCIVLGNRMLGGCSYYQYSIRYVHELRNVVSTGIIALEKGQYCIWETEQFAFSDLSSYLRDNTSYYKVLNDSMMEVEYVTSLEKHNIVQKTWALDIVHAKQLIQKEVETLYRKVGDHSLLMKMPEVPLDESKVKSNP